MAREHNIPLFLWVATAALAHILWGGGAEQVARVVEERGDVLRFANQVRSYVERENRTLEVELLEDGPMEENEQANDGDAKPSDDEQDPEETPTEDEDDKPRDPQDVDTADKAKPSEAQEDEAKAERDPKSKDTPKPEQKKAEKKKEEVAKAEEAKPLKLVPTRRRTAVRQHVEDKNQEDNPDAEFIADEANHTDKETQARITSTDQMAPDPNPGMNHSSPSSDPGNAHVTDIGQSDATPGDPTKAFAESPEHGKDDEVRAEDKPVPTPSLPSQMVFGEPTPASRGSEQGASNSEFASKGQKAREALEATEESPRLIAGEHGAHVVPPESEARTARAGRQARRQQAAPKGNGGRAKPSLRSGDSLALTPGGLNPNLTPLAAITAIGSDQLNKERRADGERRLSKHRGSWRTMGLERWRSAIENYVASVQPGNQTQLNTARVPFAGYLNRIHLRLHEVFAFGFLPSLSALPSDHPLNRRDLKTHLEIVLSREDGRVVRMGVTRASGATAFDVGALESVQRASPYGAPPREIVSPDGNVYLHWEFHRDPIYACATYFARPYILRAAPTPAPLPAPSPNPATPMEGQQHGLKEETTAGTEKGG